jgi:PAS domain S-box-containing protein
VIEREKYADLYNFAPVAYFTFDEEGVIVDLNLTAADLLGQTRKYLKNHPIVPYLPPDALQTFIQHREQVFKSHRTQTCELLIRRQDNTQSIVQTHSIALETYDESPRLWRSIMTDINVSKSRISSAKVRKGSVNFLIKAVRVFLYSTKMVA